MIFNIPVGGKQSVLVSVYGAVNETVTLTGVKGDSFTATTNEHGIAAALELPVGVYTVVGSVSKDALASRSVTVDKNTTEVTAYPPGAIYWFGNGAKSGDTLYSVCGGISGATATNTNNFTAYILSGSNSLYNKTANTGNAVSIAAGKTLKFYWNSPYISEQYYISGAWKYKKAYGTVGLYDGASVTPNADGTRVSEIAISSAVTKNLYMAAYAQGGTGNTACTCTMYAIWAE